MRNSGYFLLLLLASWVGGVAQQTNETPAVSRAARSPLVVSSTVSAPNHLGTSMLLPVRCDAERNIYVRFYHGTNSMREPIYKFDRNGQLKSSYSPDADPTFVGKGRGGKDFAIGKDGTIYQIAAAADGNWVVSYKQDGSIAYKFKIEPRFTAHHLEVFDSGNILVMGVESGTATDPDPHGLYTVLFSARGRMLKRIVLSEDAAYEEAAKRGDSAFIDSSDGGNVASSFGSITRASDGNLYLVRFASPTTVYAIGPNGDVTGSFEIKSELEGEKPRLLLADGGRLAIQFVGDANDRRSIVEIFMLDGRKIKAYDATAMGGPLACYSSRDDSYTFLTASQGSLNLNLAGPR